MRAEGLATRLAVDPQMQGPERPRLSEDYQLVPLDPDGLVVLGGERPQAFRGRSARTLLPRLLPLLDGTRREADLAAALPDLPRPALRDVLALLFMRGLLEDGGSSAERQAEGQLPPALRAQLRYFGRYTDVSRSSRQRYETQRRLERARVALLAAADSAHEAELLARALKAAGVGEVQQALDPAELERGTTLVVALTCNEERAGWTRLDGTCRRLGLPWLRAVLRPRGLEVGPLFCPDETACYGCARLFLDDGPSGPPRGAARELALRWLELTVSMELTGLFPPLLTDRVRSFDLATLEHAEHQVLRLPRCPVCGGGSQDDRSLALPEDLPGLFHLHTNHRWRSVAPKSHQVHYSTEVGKISHGAFKTYPLRPKTDLPALAVLPPPRGGLSGAGAAPPARTLDLAALTPLLGWSAAWRAPEQGPLRYTPSGGGLCSPDLYLLAFDVEDLAPGLYHYEGRRHRLELLAEGDRREELAAALPPAALEGAGAAVLVTSQLARLLAKYGARSYRYAHLDAGVMGASLGLLARAVGLAPRLHLAFDDEALARLLGLTTWGEFPALVVAVGLHPEARA